MKAKLFAVIALLAVSIYPASADDAWIKVDANGNAVGGAIVCSVGVCGDPQSTYSQLTLQPGERYVLQFKGDPVTGNVAGIPATDPNVKLSVNVETNEWTRTYVEPLREPTPVVIQGTVTVVTGVEKKQTWNPTVEGKETPAPVTTPEPTEENNWWYSDFWSWDWSSWDLWWESFIRWYELNFPVEPETVEQPEVVEDPQP